MGTGAGVWANSMTCPARGLGGVEKPKNHVASLKKVLGKSEGRPEPLSRYGMLTVEHTN